MFLPIGQLSSSLMQVVGKSGLLLKLEFPKKFIYLIYIFIGFQYGVIGLTITMIAINLTGALINMYATRKILVYSYVQQIVDIAKYMILAYGLGFINNLVISIPNHLISIIESFLFMMLSYMVVLYLIKDSIFIKYLKLGYNYVFMR